MIEKLIRWAVARYMVGYHLSKNPVREKKTWKEATVEELKAIAYEVGPIRKEGV